ncbi:MAG: GNAT family N-acetyltransferase [Firmicutes bacterium]|nr:GNAT family N-acetyltransferase [Bacillota bacterium]
MILETKDLIIRPSVWEDIEDFYKWEQMPEVTEFFSIGDGQTKEEVIRKYIADDQNPQAQQFTILLKENPDIMESLDFGPETEAAGTRKVGRIVLGDIEDGWKAEVWRIYIADKNLRGKGYGKQAMEAVLGYCFDMLDLQRVYLDHYTGNPAAQLYLSLGFKYEGVLRRNCRKNGVLYDVHLMSMLRDEYEAMFE